MTKFQIVVRRVIQNLWDFFSWTLSIPIATLLRYDIEVGNNVLLTALKFGIYLGVIMLWKFFRAASGRFRFKLFLSTKYIIRSIKNARRIACK